MCRRALERGLPGAALAHAIDDVSILLAHRGEHCTQQLGRILQVGVDDQDRIPAAEIEASGQSQLVTMVSGEVHGYHVRILGCHSLHGPPTSIA